MKIIDLRPGDSVDLQATSDRTGTLVRPEVLLAGSRRVGERTVRRQAKLRHRRVDQRTATARAKALLNATRAAAHREAPAVEPPGVRGAQRVRVIACIAEVSQDVRPSRTRASQEVASRNSRSDVPGRTAAACPSARG